MNGTTYVWQTCENLKLLYDVQQAISKWGVDVLAQKLVVVTKDITNYIHIFMYNNCTHIKPI
jgi:hypothetical protein